MSVFRQLPGFVIGLAAGAALIWAWKGGSDHDSSAISPVPAPTETSSGKLALQREAKSSEAQAKSLEQTIGELAMGHDPALRHAKLTQLGHELAGKDLEAAMRKIDSLRFRPEKVALLKGIFTRVAKDLPPYEAIQRVKRLDKDLEEEGLKSIVSVWTYGEVRGNGFGRIYAQLLGDNRVSDEVKEAWMKAYQNHPDRGRMFASWASALVQESPEDAEALGQGLTGWQRDEFVSNLAMHRLMDAMGPRKSPDGRKVAWDWLQQHRDAIDSEAIARMVSGWHVWDREEADEVFAEMTDSEDRLAVASALAEKKASHGTEEALAWADGLPNQQEREAAHEAIYQATPRGIGAMLDMNEGVPVVSGILDDTPAAAAGLRNGDRLIGVDPGTGGFERLNDLKQTVDLIRGEPGTPLRLRVLRGDGSMEVIRLNRQQLVFDKPRNVGLGS